MERDVLLGVQRAREARRQHEAVERALAASGAVHSGPPRLPGDRLGLRGTPVITRGVSGTMLGTDPLGEVLRREARRERRRKP